MIAGVRVVGEQVTGQDARRITREETMTIVEAAQQALASLGRAATPKEIYAEINKKGLYTFGAKSPVSVLSGAMSERTEGSARLKGRSPMFRKPEKGKFELIR